jgi:hypothetical protein
MIQHIFECPSSSPDPLAADCQCARLSACERRVLAACIAEVEGMPWHFSGIADVIDRVELLPRLRAVLAQEHP